MNDSFESPTLKIKKKGDVLYKQKDYTKNN